MNNLYLLEKLAALKQQQALREAEQARLLREAGLSGANLLAKRRERLQAHCIVPLRKRRSDPLKKECSMLEMPPLLTWVIG